MKTVIASYKYARLVLYITLLLVIGSICSIHAKDVHHLSSGNIQIIFYNSEDQGTIPYKYNLEDWPSQAKTAIIDALHIVEEVIEIESLMTIGTIWSGDLNEYLTLAETYTKFGNVQTRGASSELDATYKYPRELLNQIDESNRFDGENIVMAFNAKKDWNFLKEQEPTLHQQDLITVCLHEILHGLGISSSFTKSNESKPYVYDQYIVDGNGDPIIDYPTENSQQAALRSNNLFYNGPNILDINNGEPIKLHAPDNFTGASLCHLDRQYQHDEKGNLLIPGTNYGQSNREFGDYVLAMLDDLGWHIKVDYKNPMSANENMTESMLQIHTQGNTVNIINSAYALMHVSIFSISGKMIYDRKSYTDETFQLLPHTMYIVKVNNKSYKIRIA